MNTHDLRLFNHLAGSLHFGKTSRACYVSPSTLSRSIQRLEEEVGAPLFVRDNRHVELTPAGVTFRRYAEDTLSNWEQITAELTQRQERLSGELRLYCSVTASYAILPDILSAFRSRHQDVQITLITGDAAVAMDRVQEGTADLAIAPVPERLPDGIESRLVARTPLIFIGPTGEEAIPFHKNIDWATVPMIVPETGLMRIYIRRWFRDQGLQPNIYAQVSGHEAIISLVSLGFGVGVIPELVLEKSIIKPDITVLDVRPALPEFIIGLCAKKSKLKSPLVEAFWKIVEIGDR